MIRPIRWLLAAGLLCARPVRAQVAPQFTIGAMVDGLRGTARGPGGRQVSTGLLAGASVALHAGFLALAVEYGEGSLRAAGATNDRTLVQGSASAALQLNPWLSVGAAVAARRMVETDPERWLAWAATARLEVPIIGRGVVGIARFEQGLGGEVNVVAEGVRSQQGEVALRFALPGRTYWIEGGTRVERYSAGGETRTLEQYGIAVGLRWP
jgi:hypothetical protein